MLVLGETGIPYYRVKVAEAGYVLASVLQTYFDLGCWIESDSTGVYACAAY